MKYKRHLLAGFIAGLAFSLFLPTRNAQAGGGFYDDVHAIATSLNRIAISLEQHK